MSFRAIIDVLNIFKTSMRAMYDYSLGAFRKHAKSRTGHNADIYDTRSSAMHKIPLDGTTGTVYHPRATIELALTCNLTSMVARHTGDRDFTV